MTAVAQAVAAYAVGTVIKRAGAGCCAAVCLPDDPDLSAVSRALLGRCADLLGMTEIIGGLRVLDLALQSFPDHMEALQTRLADPHPRAADEEEDEDSEEGRAPTPRTSAVLLQALTELAEPAILPTDIAAK